LVLLEDKADKPLARLIKNKRENKKYPKIRITKEIIKIRAEIIEKELKEIIGKINRTKSWFF